MSYDKTRLQNPQRTQSRSRKGAKLYKENELRLREGIGTFRQYKLFEVQ